MLKPTLAALALILLLAVPTTSATRQRPVLRTARRSASAGKILFIPTPPRTESVAPAGRSGELRMLAEIVDYRLITPPESIYRQPSAIPDWIRSSVRSGVDGLILSWSAISGDRSPGAIALRSGLLEELRRERPLIPIYAVAGEEDTDAIGQLGSGRIDFLAIFSPSLKKTSSIDPEIARRTTLSADYSSATSLLLTRMVNVRFGITPRIYPVYSRSGNGSIRQMVSARIESTGGTEYRLGGSRPPDILLFIQLPGTGDGERREMIDAMARTIDRGVRIALLDLSEEETTSQSLTSAILERRWLDRLAAWAEANGEDEADSPTHETAMTRAISQSSLFLSSIRFLRDDLDRLLRVDRAQAAMLLCRYLTDHIYPRQIRPTIEAKPESRNDEPLDSLEQETLTLLQPFANHIFANQFRRNIHATLLSSGERASFEIALLQQLRVRIFPRMGSAPQSRRRLEIEIRPSVHLTNLGNFTGTRTSWELVNDDLDKRVLTRLNEIQWNSFKVETENVRLHFRISTNLPFTRMAQAEQGYRILSKGSRTTRRIEVSAQSPKGAFYALSRIEELGRAGLLARDLDLTERPTIATRALLDDRGTAPTLQQRLELIDFLGRNRINRYLIRLSEPTLDPAWIEELKQAADSRFVELSIISPTDESTSPLIPLGPDSALPCLAPIEPPAPSSTQHIAPGSKSITFRLPHAAYSFQPRLASAALFAWAPESYDPREALFRYLSGEEPTAATGLRSWIEATPDACQSAITPSITPPFDRLDSAIDSLTGRLPAALLRGELRSVLQMRRAALIAR